MTDVYTFDSPAGGESAACAHVVQFYDTSDFLLDTLSQYVGAALLGGHAAVVIAMRRHREGILRRLESRGLDSSVAISAGYFVVLDADATLARLMRNERPDRDRFRAVITDVLRRARAAAPARLPKVAAYGEMVAVLSAQGKQEAAIELEQLWNDLLASESVCLRCAYPVEQFRYNPELLTRVCRQHTHVIPAEGYDSGEDHRRVRDIIEEHREPRRAVAD